MKLSTRHLPSRLLATLVLAGTALAANAEGRISIAQQFGIGYLILDVLQDQKLIEKHGKAAGVDIKVEWSKGRQNVKAVASLGSLPNYLITNNPKVKTIKDLSDKDRIAVPAAGTGFQSRTLQIETARVFGKDEFKKFDNISVSLPHPDATAALISGGSEINTHFSSAPFYYQALENKNVHKVISSYQILGGPATFNVLYTTQKFHDENPKTYKAFYAALVEAAQFVKGNKAKAAETFIRVQKSKLPLEFVRKIVEDPENDFTISPVRTFVYANELQKLGVIKNSAASWKDYFFEEAHANPGS